MTYAFTFDASACTGCKACQVACKDKNNLPVGVLWRRVYEVSGGSWQQHGHAWVTDVFAYNLTIACNHCVHPKCAGVCPTDAYVQREDGIVYIDETKCMGCGYCNWACPYGVPQYNPELGRMTKCNFCMDNIEAGLPPACVAACPMRVLDFIQVDSGQWTVAGEKPLWEVPANEHPFPLPGYSRTEPHLAIRPHPGMLNALEKNISNREEIRPAEGKSEWSLVTFTLLTQMAVGMAIFSLFSGPLRLPVSLIQGGLLGFAGLLSLLHLGRPANAWRAMIHLKKSWLSREILMFTLFGAGWLVSLVMPRMGKIPLTLTGIGFVYSMAQVYRLRSVPAWDTWRTNAGFFMTALLTGPLLTAVLLAFESGAHLPPIEIRVAASLAALLLAGQSALQLTGEKNGHSAVHRLRLGLTAMALALSLILFLFPNHFAAWAILSIFLIVTCEETLGRWLFYEARMAVKKS